MTPNDQHRNRPTDRGGPPKDPSILARFKEFAPTSFAVDHATSVKVLLFIITVMGLYVFSLSVLR